MPQPIPADASPALRAAHAIVDFSLVNAERGVVVVRTDIETDPPLSRADTMSIVQEGREVFLFGSGRDAAFADEPVHEQVAEMIESGFARILVGPHDFSISGPIEAQRINQHALALTVQPRLSDGAISGRSATLILIGDLARGVVVADPAA